MLLFVNSLAHLLVDGVCAAAMFGPLRGQTDFTALLYVYNTLAFSTQCLVGLAADRLRGMRVLTAAGMLLVALGFALPIPALPRTVLLGLGNSAFHVGGGTETLRGSRGKAGPLGVFVAPGAVGLTLGTLRPMLGSVFALLLAAAAVTVLLLRTGAEPPAPAGRRAMSPRRIAAILLLTAAVAIRAVGGSAVSFPWKTTALLTFVTTLCVFAGKTLGGFVCDRLGPKRSAWVSIPAAAALIAFCGPWMLPSLVGQLALNLTMPITLWLLYRAMPETPGFAFGLAAAALWPGTVAGMMLTPTGPVRQLILLACLLFGLFAILFAASSETSRSEETEVGS